MEVSITIIPKPDKETIRKENYSPISLINIGAKALSRHKWTEFHSILKGLYTTTKWGLFLEYKHENQSVPCTPLTEWRLKPHDHPSGCRKVIWQGSKPVLGVRPWTSNLRNLSFLLPLPGFIIKNMLFLPWNLWRYLGSTYSLKKGRTWAHRGIRLCERSFDCWCPGSFS